MAIDRVKEEAGWRVTLSGELDIAQAARLKECLLECLKEPSGRVVFDLGGVESLDICCLQVLLAAWRAAAPRGPQLSVARMSAACREAVELAALDSEQWPACLEVASH